MSFLCLSALTLIAIAIPPSPNAQIDREAVDSGNESRALESCRSLVCCCPFEKRCEGWVFRSIA